LRGALHFSPCRTNAAELRPPIALASIAGAMVEDEALAVAAIRARARWSERGLRDDLAGFTCYLETRVARVTEPLRARLHIDDLYLAFACGRGDRAALAVFEAELVPSVRRVLARMHIAAGLGDDVLGALRERLFVPAHGATPLIADYSGRGRLVCWLRSVAANAALKALRDGRRFVELEQADELPMVDAELAQLRSADAAAFRDALARAFAGLARDQRTILRQHFLDGLTFEALGRLHGVHVSTAWRRVEAARLALVEAVRRQLGEALGASDSAVNRIVRSAYIEASVSSLLRLTPAAAGA
jgi:RNA polymerase sigma-70 factor (ECF subfamily)